MTRALAGVKAMVTVQVAAGARVLQLVVGMKFEVVTVGVAICRRGGSGVGQGDGLGGGGGAGDVVEDEGGGIEREAGIRGAVAGERGGDGSGGGGEGEGSGALAGGGGGEGYLDEAGGVGCEGAGAGRAAGGSR